MVCIGVCNESVFARITIQYVPTQYIPGMSCPNWPWHRTGSRWSPVRTLPVGPLWCDRGFFPYSRGNKAAANLRPTNTDRYVFNIEVCIQYMPPIHTIIHATIHANTSYTYWHVLCCNTCQFLHIAITDAPHSHCYTLQVTSGLFDCQCTPANFIFVRYNDESVMNHNTDL